VRERRVLGMKSSTGSHPQGSEDMTDGFPLNDVVGRLVPTESSIAVMSTIVRSNSFDRSCLVIYTSWPICMQTMMMMIAGYML
jgi:hypothetical protein